MLRKLLFIFSIIMIIGNISLAANTLENLTPDERAEYVRLRKKTDKNTKVEFKENKTIPSPAIKQTRNNQNIKKQIFTERSGFGFDISFTSRDYDYLHMPGQIIPEIGIKYYSFNKQGIEWKLYYGRSSQFDFDGTWGLTDGVTLATFDNAKIIYYGFKFKHYFGNKFMNDCAWAALGFDFNDIINESTDSGFKVSVIKADVGYSFKFDEMFYVEPSVSIYNSSLNDGVLDSKVKNIEGKAALNFTAGLTLSTNF